MTFSRNNLAWKATTFQTESQKYLFFFFFWFQRIWWLVCLSSSSWGRFPLDWDHYHLMQEDKKQGIEWLCFSVSISFPFIMCSESIGWINTTGSCCQRSSKNLQGSCWSGPFADDGCSGISSREAGRMGRNKDEEGKFSSFGFVLFQCPLLFLFLWLLFWSLLLILMGLCFKTRPVDASAWPTIRANKRVVRDMSWLLRHVSIGSRPLEHSTTYATWSRASSWHVRRVKDTIRSNPRNSVPTHHSSNPWIYSRTRVYQKPDEKTIHEKVSFFSAAK